jgi:hypothetical protein
MRRAVSEHPNKHIRAAVDHAVQHGWTLRIGGPRAHIWGRLYCPRRDRQGCKISVFSTPRVPEEHARWIRHKVERCQHGPNAG